MWTTPSLALYHLPIQPRIYRTEIKEALYANKTLIQQTPIYPTKMNETESSSEKVGNNPVQAFVPAPALNTPRASCLPPPVRRDPGLVSLSMNACTGGPDRSRAEDNCLVSARQLSSKICLSFDQTIHSPSRLRRAKKRSGRHWRPDNTTFITSSHLMMAFDGCCEFGRIADGCLPRRRRSMSVGRTWNGRPQLCRS
jgi:hypothetical protein